MIPLPTARGSGRKGVFGAFYLSRLPQRVDIVILELVGTAPGVARKLLSIFHFLRPHNLIEFKGPTDDLAAEDALFLLAYGAQYMRLKKLKAPSDICLMVIADRIPPAFVEQIERLQGRFAPIDKGLWQGELAGAVLHGVETDPASQRGPTEQILYAFSRAFLRDPRGGLPLDEEARRRAHTRAARRRAHTRAAHRGAHTRPAHGDS